MSGLSVAAGTDVGMVTISVTPPGTGMSAQQIAELCTSKIVYVGPDVPPAIRDQAMAYREHVLQVVTYYTEQAQRSQMTTAIGLLERAGLHVAADLLRTI